MAIQNRIREQVEALALELNVIGLMNVQMAVQGEDVFVLEVNPRASRTVPRIAIGHSRRLPRDAWLANHWLNWGLPKRSFRNLYTLRNGISVQ